MENGRNSFLTSYINDIYIELGDLILNYLQKKPISVIENNINLTLINSSQLRTFLCLKKSSQKYISTLTEFD
jgi:hypothetical protein